MAEITKTFLRDLNEKDHFQTAVLVKSKSSGKDRNGKAFLSLTVCDSSGELNARMFEKVEDVESGFDSGDIVWLKGFVQVFQNRKQIIVQDVRKAVEGEYKITDVVAAKGGDPSVHWCDLQAAVAGMRDPFIRKLVEGALADESIKAALLKAPAAKSIHHAYFGGLVEHIVSIVKIMQALAEHYTFLDLDLLVFGAVFHDIGKIFELEFEQGIRYTRRGRLVGHMAIACEMIDGQAAAITGFPEETKDVLKHIVLSHHGKLEYGSPKLPMLPEAVVVAMVDDMDSKLNTLFHFLKDEVESVPDDDKWSHYHPGFERHFFLEFFRRNFKEPKR